MKRIRFIAISSLLIGLLMLIGIYSSAINSSKNNGRIEVIQGIVCGITYGSIDKLENGSDLIVVASTAQKLERRKPVQFFMPDGSLSDFYTLTKINVKKILKQPENFKLGNGKSINIHEPVVLIDDKVGKRLLTSESYSPLIENDEYVLFLKANDKGEYCIINRYRGKFNLSKDESVYEPLVPYQDDYKSKYLEMKKELSKKYSFQVKETN